MAHAFFHTPQDAGKTERTQKTPSQKEGSGHTRRKRGGLLPLRLPFLPVFFLCAVLVFLLVRLLLFAPYSPLSQDRAFGRFTEEIFRNEMRANTLSMHYTVASPENFHLDDAPVSLGDASLAARKRGLASMENYRDTLKKFDRSKLSEKHRLTYDIFLDYLDTELGGAAFLLYDEPLRPTLGIHAQLPVLLAEYTFRTKGDIEDYLALLSQVPDYFASILSFERDKAAAGLFMSRSCAAETASQCEAFAADAEHNTLADTFDDKIDAVSNLTADEKAAYKSCSDAALSASVIPAYQNLASSIRRLSGSGKNDRGLYYAPDGAAYYRYLVKSTVGDSRSIEEIEEAVKRQLVADFTAIQKLQGQESANKNAQSKYGANAAASAPENTDGSAQSKYGTNAAASAPEDADGSAQSKSGTNAAASAPENADGSAQFERTAVSSPSAMLDELRQDIAADFPLLPPVSCSVKYVHKALQKNLSPAFYLTSPIDDCENNVIYINPAGGYDGLELFTTLAHEGYPGHLYQSVYFNTRKPDLLRCLLDVGGYTEGWATYVEMYAYSLWDGDPAQAELTLRNRSFTLGLASLLDIGIHYRGYTSADVSAFLGKLGFGADTAQSLYDAILQAPANYLQYYVGCLNFCSLRDQVKAAQKEHFSLREFHRLVLETGPAPFDILRRELERKRDAADI